MTSKKSSGHFTSEASLFEDCNSKRSAPLAKRTSQVREDGLVLFLCSLSEDLMTHLMIFGEMADAKNALALTCRTLNKNVWDSKSFWLALGGPAFLEESFQEIQTLYSASATRSVFRRWVFGIGQGWSHRFANRVDELAPAEALQDAYFLISGISRFDAPTRDICSLVDSTVKAIGRSADDDNDSLATALVDRCRSRTDLFNWKQVKDLEVALDEAAERAMLRHIQAAEDDLEYEDDFDELEEKDAFEKDQLSKDYMHDPLVASPEQAISSGDASWLSQRFLMVMSDHHGWD